MCNRCEDTFTFAFKRKEIAFMMECMWAMQELYHTQAPEGDYANMDNDIRIIGVKVKHSLTGGNN